MDYNIQQSHCHQKARSGLAKFKVGALASAISFIFLQSASSFASDIEIYTKPADSMSSASVVLMLDTSGSMDISETGNNDACDLPQGVTGTTRKTNQNHPDGRGYKVNYCESSSAKKYYYRKISECIRSGMWGSCIESSDKWFSCGTSGTTSKSTSTCATQLASAPSINGYTSENGSWSDNSTYYYKTDSKGYYYDRISRLKNALYDLATTPTYNEITSPNGIKENVNIGFGTYPYYVPDSENNLRGYIRIPASKWDATQKQKVLDMINSSSFRGVGGTPTSAAYAEAAAYLLGTTTGGGTYSGMGLAPSSIVSGSGTARRYITPLSTETAACSGQGIYFLTDGQPQTPKNTDTTNLMAKALKRTSYILSTGIPNNGTYDSGSYKSDWQAIGSFAKSLNDLAIVRTASGIDNLSRPVSTAVVGFGSGITGNDAANVQAWGLHEKSGGIYGRGGYIAASEPEEIVHSLNEFIKGVSGEIPSISTGSSTIPLDALNPEIIQPYSYFPQFEPKVSDDAKQQLWFGNLKKYHVVNNGIFADDAGTKRVVVEVDKKSRLQDFKDIWGGASDGNLPVYAKYGVLAKLKLGTVKQEEKITGRNIVTDYVYDPDNGIRQNLALSRITHEYTTADQTKTDNPERIKGLMGLLGYNISNANQDLSTVTAGMRQMGSILHSLPILLTQEGQAVAKQEGANVVIDTANRKDYVLFGTTQGLLHVVDADSGEEKFAFLPKEMAEKQYELFKYNAGTWDYGKNALYYGIDGEWTAHTVYVSKADGTLAVDGVLRNVTGSEDEKENLKGKQWVYGGLRMGGRSYYALDLTDLNDSASYKPKIKFHIDPETGSVHRSTTKDGVTTTLSKVYPAIAKMGQSWSKPKLDYVSWNGERKLVMFVGGGYDAGGEHGDGLYDGARVRKGYAGYESYNYKQTNEIGSGVYMFDADNGDLLWYASKTKHSTLEGIPEGTQLYNANKHTQHDNLEFSVVSDIKTVDRNNDGIVDHVYFGDLAGQAFRIDLNKVQNGQPVFEPQATRILNLHQTDGTSQRFYYAPMFTAHHSANGMTPSGTRYVEGGNIVMVTFVSGNKSSPLLATTASTQHKTSTGLQMDGVFGIYEYDIHPTGVYYPTTRTAAKTLAANATLPSLTQLMPLSVIVNAKNATTRLGATIHPTNGWGGWYYKFDKNFENGTKTAGVIKGVSPLVAMEGNLYVTVYDASEDGSTETCGAGVKGQSFTQRLCLPSGVCQEQANYKYNLGSGIVGLNVGPMDSSSGGNKGIIIPDPTRIENMKCEGVDCPEASKRFIAAGGALKFIPHRWYEHYAIKE